MEEAVNQWYDKLTAERVLHPGYGEAKHKVRLRLFVKQINEIALNTEDDRGIPLLDLQDLLNINMSSLREHVGNNLVSIGQKRIFIELAIANSGTRDLVKNHMYRRNQIIDSAVDNLDRKSVDKVNQLNQMIKSCYYEMNHFIDGRITISGYNFNEINDMLKYMFLWDGALFSTLVWKIDESWLLPQDRNENLRYRQKHEFLERIVKKGLSAP